MLVASNILAAGGNVATSFISGDEVSAFAACRFVSGMATDSNFVMMYIIGEDLNNYGKLSWNLQKNYLSIQFIAFVYLTILK